MVQFYQIFKELLVPISHKLFQEDKERLPKSLYGMTRTPKPDKDKKTTDQYPSPIMNRHKNPQQNTSEPIQISEKDYRARDFTKNAWLV